MSAMRRPGEDELEYYERRYQERVSERFKYCCWGRILYNVHSVWLYCKVLLRYQRMRIAYKYMDVAVIRYERTRTCLLLSGETE